MNNRKIASELRVQKALERIEAAQNLLSTACADLSAIVGAITPWKKASKLSDKCHDLWREIAYHPRTKWQLDHDPE